MPPHRKCCDRTDISSINVIEAPATSIQMVGSCWAQVRSASVSDVLEWDLCVVLSLNYVLFEWTALSKDYYGLWGALLLLDFYMDEWMLVS